MSRDSASESARKARDLDACLFGHEPSRDMAIAGLASVAYNPEKWAWLMQECKRIGREYRRRQKRKAK